MTFNYETNIDIAFEDGTKGELNLTWSSCVQLREGDYLHFKDFEDVLVEKVEWHFEDDGNAFIDLQAQTFMGSQENWKAAFEKLGGNFTIVK